MTKSPDLLRRAFRFMRNQGAPADLALFKARAALARGEKFYTYAPTSFGMGKPPRDGDSVFLQDPEAAGFRVVADASKVVDRLPLGWYCDSHQDETFVAVVLQLPARGGMVRFVAGYREPWNGGVVVDLSRGGIFEEPAENVWQYCGAENIDAARDAARAADRFTERAAEEARDYHSAWQDGNRFADLGEQVKTTRREILAILAERRTLPKISAPRLCEAIRAQVESMLDSISEARAKRDKLKSGDVESCYFWPGDSRLAAAFNDGAGEVVL